MSVSSEIAGSKQVSLTTYRKDGRAVSSPVWHVIDQDTMLIVSEADAGKVKRIRNNPNVQVTVCDIRGRVAAGAQPVPGTARLLDDEGTGRARDLLARRYITSRVGNWLAKALRLKRNPLIGIAISF